MPELLEDDILRPHDSSVLVIPYKSPEDAIHRSEPAIETLERIKYYSEKWIAPGHIEGANHNNVSSTVNVREYEWPKVKDWLFKNRYFFTGISLFPYNNKIHPQAPFEECSKETYERLTEKLKEIDLSLVEDYEDKINLQGELACAGGACEVTEV